MKTSQDQWDEAYMIAERMYTGHRAEKRTDQNIYEQIVCSRFKKIFSYDPYKDEYDFIDQQLLYDEPIRPSIRTIAEADLDNLKQNTVNSQLESPAYLNITPIYVVPPSTVLVFNNSQGISDDLNEALQTAVSALTVNPSETEITPGAEFVFKHKNGKCYRCIIISEVGDEEVADSERRYEVAFLDHCQIVPVKLKTLFIPGELTVEKYPCALHCVRPLGVSSFRSGFVNDFNTDIRKFYNDREKRRIGVMGYLYKTDENDKKLVMDFPSINGIPYTNSELLKLQHGCLVDFPRDPIALTYAQLSRMEVLPLKYPEEDDEENGENNDEGKNRKDMHGKKGGDNQGDDSKVEDDDDVELDLTDSDHNSEKVKVSAGDKDDCPFGRSSIDMFVLKTQKQAIAEAPLIKKVLEPLTEVPLSSSIQFDTGEQLPNNNHAQESGLLDNTCNESISSLRSATINQTGSSIPTPQPTFDVPPKDDLTPKKASFGDDGSSTGWGDDTPKTNNTIVKNVVANEFGTTQKPVKKLSFAVPDSDFPQAIAVPEPSTPSSPLSHPRPLSPIPQDKLPTFTHGGNPEAVPLMSMTISTPEKFKASGTDAAFENERGENNNTDKNKALPSISGIIKSANRSSIFGCSNDTLNIDRLSNHFDETDINENKSENGSVLKNNNRPCEKSYLESDILNPIDHGECSQAMIHHSDNASVCQDANISKASTNQLLINTAQDNFNDSDDEEWEKPLTLLEKQNNNCTETEEVFIDVVDENFSRKSVCSGDFGDVEEDSPELGLQAIVDEFAGVPENLKQIAASFVDSIREAAIQKNHHVYMVETIALEVLAQKMPNDVEKRFMRAKIAEAKSLDEAFD